ncbi:MAG: DUF1802 family protein [Verrucomicrobiota bacterium]
MTENKATAFKEWVQVCEALGSGRQIVILRKGGIAEGREGFQFKHSEFFLFPTVFHAAADQLKPDWQGEPVEEGAADAERTEVCVDYFAEIAKSRVLTDWEEVKMLDKYHGWTEETIRARFDYDEAPGVSLAVVRVYRLPETWVFPFENKHGGCRS